LFVFLHNFICVFSSYFSIRTYEIFFENSYSKLFHADVDHYSKTNNIQNKFYWFNMKSDFIIHTSFSSFNLILFIGKTSDFIISMQQANPGNMWRQFIIHLLILLFIRSTILMERHTYLQQKTHAFEPSRCLLI